MAFKFQQATKKQAKLRMAIIGPSGAGKTYTALNVGQHLGNKIAFIDTERGSASKYAGKFKFDVLELESHEPSTYVEAIEAAEKAGYDVVIIDSLSHAWMGKGGALEQVDRIAKRSQSGNSFTAWRDVTPQHNALVEAMLRCKCHLIATMRAKTEYVLEEDSRGKKTPRKIGLAPVQRDGMEYEFDLVGDITLEHELLVSKSRCEALDGKVIPKPGEKMATALVEWLTDGAEPAPEKKAEPGGAPQVAPETLAEIEALWPKYGQKLGGKVVTFADYLHQKKHISDPRWMTQPEAVKMLEWLQEQERIATGRPATQPALEVKAPAPQEPTLATDPAYEQARKEIIADLREAFLAQGETEAEWAVYEVKLWDKTADDLEALLADLKKKAAAPAQPEPAQEVETVAV